MVGLKYIIIIVYCQITRKNDKVIYIQITLLPWIRVLYLCTSKSYDNFLTIKKTCENYFLNRKTVYEKKMLIIQFKETFFFNCLIFSAITKYFNFLFLYFFQNLYEPQYKESKKQMSIKYKLNHSGISPILW